MAQKSLIRKIGFTLNLLLWLAFLLGLAVAYTPVTDYLLKPLAVQADVRNADSIVVLGGGIDRGRFLTFRSSQRLMRGAQLYFEGRASKIIFSGGTSKENSVAEAVVMAQEARRLRIPLEAMLLEKNSKRTSDQGLEVRKIAGPLRLKSILLVTSYSHMKRAVMVFEEAGFKVYPAPADPYERYVDGPGARLRLFPDLVHEYGGIVYYKVRGWI